MPTRCIALLLFPLLHLAAGTIEGVVHDPSGAAVPHCAVTLTAATPFRGETDALGKFQFSPVPDGKYALTIQCEGFEPHTRSIDAGATPVLLSIDLKIAVQETTVEVGGKRSSLANSDPNYAALRNAVPGHSYKVSNLVLKRDAGTFTFTSGTFSFVPAVLGKVPAAVFVGEGSFHLQPVLFTESNYLRLVTGNNEVDETFRSVVLWFSDQTYDEIIRQAEPVDAPSPAAGAWQEFRNRTRHRTDNPRSFIEYMLQNENIVNQEAEILGELQMPKEPGSFRAFMHGNKNGDLRFIVNPRGALPYLPSPEEVALINVDPTGPREGIWYLTHTAAEWKEHSASSTENRHIVQAEHYRIETVIGKNDHLGSTCAIKFKALTAGTRVISFGLLPSLRVLRVTQADREIAFIQEKRKEDGSFYVIMPQPLVEGRSYEIGIEYEGNKVVEKQGSGNFSVGARTSWYPSLNAFTDRATYDLTFRVPREYKLVAVGNLEKEWRDEGYAASHWVSDIPMAVAGFNYGSYKMKSVNDTVSKYQVEAYATREAPDYLRQINAGLSPSSMAESAMVDAQNAIRLFQTWYGDAPYGRIAITQQPEFSFGQSWPTLVYLPVSAFLDSTQRYLLLGGSSFRFADFIDEVTPHEVAHQWWGHMVGWASYRDQWLSEGFADFSAGLFLQQFDQKSGKYLKFWEHAHKAIVEKNSFGNRANDVGPLWMGLRLNTYKTPGAYNRLIYPKGGFVLHMLRSLMFDNTTGDANFIAMMHDFVATYLHKNASTESFKAIVEKHMSPKLNLAGNNRMDWFFNEWVYGTELPSYRMDYTLEPEADGKFLFKATITQSGVSDKFLMSVPLYFDFDGRINRPGSVTLLGNSTSKELKLRLPKKPKKIMLNSQYDVLALETSVKEN